MRFKKIILQGYKTFASKTEFVFDEGITAIVGPNGSGKSNISDAIRWVLGEQSYSTLRGKRTIDMIFTGSRSRPRAGMAQAIITLDNSDGWLPIDYTEVEICRRAYRSGENEYLLNGQKVRLKDVNDLLAKAGLSEQTYTIIGQGLIDKALSLKADERRALFEEAAGISHYKNRRATTLRKLNDTQRNLERVYDILSELKPRLNTLRRQAGRAETFNQLQGDLRGLLKIWYGYQWEESKRELSRRRKEAQRVEAAWNRDRAQIGETQASIEALRQELHTIDGRISKLQLEQEEVRDLRENARREVAILQERRRALERQVEESKTDLPLLEAQRETASAELNMAMTELETVQSRLNEQTAQLTAFEKGYSDQQSAIDAARATLSRLEKAQSDAQTRIARNQGQITQLEERIKGFSTVGSGDETPMADLQNAAEAAAAAFAQIDQTRGEFRERRRTLERSIKSQRQSNDILRRDRDRARTAVTKLQTRLELVNQAAAGSAIDLSHPDLLGRLAEKIEIPADHAWASLIEEAVDTRLGTLIFDSDASLASFIDGLDEDQALSAIAQTEPSRPAALEPKTIPGWIGRASDLVTASKTDQPLVDALLGRIILSTEPIAAAKALPEGCVAAGPDGILAYPSGLVERRHASNATGLLAQERQRRELQDALDAAEGELKSAEQALEDARDQLNQLNADLDEVNQSRQKIGREANEAGQRADRAQQRLEIAQRQASRLDREKNQLNERLTKAQAQIEEDQGALVKIEADIAAGRATLDAMPVGEVRQQRNVLTQQLNATRSIVDGRRAIADSRRSTLNQVGQQVERLKLRQQTLANQLSEMNLAAKEAELGELQTRMSLILEDLDPLRKESHAGQGKLRELESRVARQQRDHQEVEARYTQTRVALTQQETFIENLQDRIHNDLGIVELSYDDEVRGDTPLPLGTAIIEKLPITTQRDLPADLEDNITRMRAQLSRMGSVNPDAPAEYEEVRERHDFMEQQIEDLEQTEKQLRSVIAELDELTSRAFSDTVNQVNSVFGDMFTRLFGGGSAHLELTDPDDLTISGVDIVAQLPGRRAQGLALLSGGERSLTAASLIFALLKVSPTPFCVMDEVDAALDEANITRFRDVLRELSQKTQFIVITHNRGTVQAASAIYGITMGTDSASQVISVRPEEYITQAELLH